MLRLSDNDLTAILLLQYIKCFGNSTDCYYSNQ